MKKLLIAAVTAAAAVSPATAAVVLFSNFDSITSPDFATQGYTIIPTADGWTSSTNGIEIQNNGVAGAPNSNPNLVELDTTTNSSMFYALAAGRYSVSYFYSPRPGVGADSNGIALSIGAMTLDSITAAGGGSTNFGLRTVDFTTTGGNLTFSAFGISDGLGGYLDDITVSTIPEPATWGLMLVGFGFVGYAARRRRTAVAA